MQSFVNTIWALATIVPSLALSVRRLHDTNKAGTTLVILYAIDFIGGVLLSVGLVMTGLGAISVIGGGSSSTGAAGTLLLIIGFIACLATSIVLMCSWPRRPIQPAARFDDPASRQRLRPSPGHATGRNRHNTPRTALRHRSPTRTQRLFRRQPLIRIRQPLRHLQCLRRLRQCPPQTRMRSDPSPGSHQHSVRQPVWRSLRNSDRSVRSTCDASRSSRPVHSGRPGNSACSPGTRSPSTAEHAVRASGSGTVHPA